MKGSGILNIELSKLIASLGHGDEIAIVDRGFPIPTAPHVKCVDLALSKNIPTVSQVLGTMIDEMTVEKIIFANETIENSQPFYKIIMSILNSKNIDPIEIRKKHEMLKQYVLDGGDANKTIRGYIRTGEFTTFGYLILSAGVGF